MRIRVHRLSSYGVFIGVLLLSSCSNSNSETQNSTSSPLKTSTVSDSKVWEPTTCPDYTDNYDLPYKYCDSGTYVVDIQNALVDAGFNVDVDGYYGPGTRAAVKKYQSSRGLSPTGQVGPSTWNSLVKSAPVSSSEEEESDDSYIVPEPSPVTSPPSRTLVSITCDLRESGLSSSWYGQSYYWTYYYIWSDGSRTTAKMGQGYDPPFDCL